MSKHTPGPWIWNPEDDECLMGKGGAHVMTLGDCYPNGGGPSEHDANIIAAAPDLLESLESLLDMGSVFISAIEANDCYSVDFEEWAVKARAAIAKAKGQTK